MAKRDARICAGGGMAAPIPAPNVRENASLLGHIDQEFDFSQAPRSPVLLATNPPTDSPSIPAYVRGQPPCVGCTTPPPAPAKARKAKKPGAPA